MSIEINHFDRKYFIGVSFKASLALGILSALMIFGIKSLNIKIIFATLYFFYFSLIFYFFSKSRNSENIVLYAQYRLISVILIAFDFIVIALILILDLGFTYFLAYFFWISVAIFFICFLEYRASWDKYISFLEDYYSSEEKYTLFDFFSSIYEFKYKINNSGFILFLFFSQISIFVLFFRSLILSSDYTIPIVVFLMFFLPCFILNHMRLYILLPYRFLLKKEKEQRML